MEQLRSPWGAPKTERIRDTYYDYSDILAKKGIWIRYRRTTSLGIEKDGPITDPPFHECWDAKVRLGGNFTESRFEEYQGEQSIRSLLSEHVRGTILEDLAVTADLETTRTTWRIRLNDRHIQPNMDACDDADYLTVALDHVSSLKEERQVSQRFPTFEHVVGEVELIKKVRKRAEDGDIAKERKTALDLMDAQIEGFMKGNPGLFSQLKPIGKLSAYFEWKGHALASVVPSHKG